MFTLTSTTTKLAVLAFSAAVSLASFQSVALSFKPTDNQVTFIELPTVVVIGQRASVVTDSAQAAVKVSTKAAS